MRQEYEIEIEVDEEKLTEYNRRASDEGRPYPLPVHLRWSLDQISSACDEGIATIVKFSMPVRLRRRETGL